MQFQAEKSAGPRRRVDSARETYIDPDIDSGPVHDHTCQKERGKANMRNKEEFVDPPADPSHRHDVHERQREDTGHSLFGQLGSMPQGD